ncbi:MAG: hypothetical protein A3J67_02885 [Parcubacteria group bacterium RIFCSPHIGHO2_02_FULL_48_10b]|nr:MAG: hypothetical protein A3J67_02885 [Parcubacteria group bacterium RIFCSPHIGHO2_02_FULL_48_10b]
MRAALIRTIAVFALFLAPFQVCLAQQDTTVVRISKEWTRLFEIIDEYYLEDINHYRCYQQAQVSGISGCLDSFSEYFSYEEYVRFTEEVNRHYAGVGMRVARRGNHFVLFPFPGTPAARAGILPYDVLAQVDSTRVTYDREITDSDQRDVVRRIRGEPGTIVQLVVQRGDSLLLPFTMQREEITYPSLAAKVIDADTAGADSIGFIGIYSESDKTAEELARAMDDFIGRGIRKFVYDLRGNPGGSFQEALDMLQLFSPAAGYLMVTKREKYTKGLYVAQAPGRYRGINIVLLTDGFTASAAEIFAGVLQDWGVAEIVGKPTFGKGVGQTLVPLWGGLVPDPGSPVLKITSFRFLLGRDQAQLSADSTLQPDYMVEFTLTQDEVEQFRREAANINLATDVYINPVLDKQLKKAVELLREK